MGALTGKELEAINFIEYYWHLNEQFPNLEAFKQEFPNFEFEEAIKKESFRTALSNRGIEIPNGTLKQNNTGLTDAQVAAVLTVVNTADRRSFNTKIKSLGITPTRWAGWMKDEKFKKFYHGTASSEFQDALPTVQKGLLKSAEEGSPAAVKLYMELTGRAVEAEPMIRNLKLAITRLVESIQIHVKDPEILRKIEADFALISKGEAPLPIVSAVAIDETI